MSEPGFDPATASTDVDWTAVPEGLDPAERDAHFLRQERRWQDEIGRHLLDRVYDAGGSAMVFHKQFDRVIDLIDLNAPGTVVEIGCGKGHFLERLRDRAGPHGPTPVGVDLSLAVTELGKKGIAGLQGDGGSLPFRDASVEAVVYHGALHHVIDYPEAIREAHRILKPGGTFYVFEPVATPFTSLLHRVLDPIVFDKCLVYESPVDLEYKDHFTKDRMLAVLRELGMSCEVSWSDWFAYPLTGCYAGSVFGRSSWFMRFALGVEAFFEKIPGIRRIFDVFAWRIRVVAKKPA